MTRRLDPGLRRELVNYGAGDLTACFSCGTCTAICPLSAEGPSFPRRIIHLMQLGHREALLSSPEPWLCYYCGECSRSCPREANPGETMMSARRWLIASYDRTGISGKIYSSRLWEWGLVLLSSAIVIILFALFHGPIVLDRVELNTFAPVEWISLADHLGAAFAVTVLLVNALTMARYIMDGERVPLSAYVKGVPTFFSHFFTQKRWKECGEDRSKWFRHFILVSGYVTMMIIIIFFLDWFQTDRVYPLLHPQRLLGYYVTFALIYGTVGFAWGRIRRDDEMHRFTHPTDWTFLILLFLIALTGILVHVFRLTGMPRLTYYTYVVHMAVDAPWLLVIIPFGKWTHLLYRPFALYLLDVKERARNAEGVREGAAA